MYSLNCLPKELVDGAEKRKWFVSKPKVGEILLLKVIRIMWSESIRMLHIQGVSRREIEIRIIEGTFKEYR